MKQLYTLLLTIVFFNVFQHAKAQVTFKYGIETGIAISHFPIKNSWNDTFVLDSSKIDKIKERWNPLYSPFLGFNTEITFKKYLQFNVGLHFQTTGTRYFYQVDGYDNLYGGTYTCDEWEEQTYLKLCLPVSAAFKFRIRKIYPSVFIGYSGNYFLTGKYYYKVVTNHEDNTHNYFYEHTFNPLKIEFPVKRLSRQIFCGASCQIKQNLKITASIMSGGWLIFSEYGYPSHGYIFENQDYTLTLTYFFDKKPK